MGMDTEREDQSATHRARGSVAAAAIKQTSSARGEWSEGVDAFGRSGEQNRRAAWHARESPAPSPPALEDKRRHRRNDWTARLRLTIEQNLGCGVSRTQAEVQTKDLSRSGFSFIYRQYIPEGSLVTASIESIPDAPTLRGRVRRCLHVGGMDHLIGVEFIGVSRA